jgi:hypothetical protein
LTSYFDKEERTAMGDDGSKPVIGPAIPAHLLKAVEAPIGSAGDNTAASRRVMGPTMPPRPDEDEPKLSAAAQSFIEREKRMKEATDREAAGLPPLAEEQKSTRPDWMMAPPTAQSYTEVLQKDHSSALKSRGFSQAQNARVQKGRGGVGGSGEADMSLWTETPQEREKRLMEEEMGIRPKAGDVKYVEDEGERLKRIADQKREEQVQRAIKEHNEKRGPSLLEKHQEKRRAEVKGKDRHRDRSEGSRKRRDTSDTKSGSDKHSRKHKRRDETGRVDKRRSKRYSSESETDSEVERRRERKHKSRSRYDDKEDEHRKHSHRHRSDSEDQRRDHDREQRRKEKRKEREREEEKEKEKEREKGEKTGAPMMVWDREAALSVGGKLMDTQKRMDTIRSASGLGSRFGSGTARFL